VGPLVGVQKLGNKTRYLHSPNKYGKQTPKRNRSVDQRSKQQQRLNEINQGASFLDRVAKEVLIFDSNEMSSIDKREQPPLGVQSDVPPDP
jgi:hypothetical protein